MISIPENTQKENLKTICFLQASLGLISPNMRVVSLVPRGEDVTLRFLLEEESEEDRECASEIATDYFAFTWNTIDGEYDIHIEVIGDRDLSSEDRIGRPIYIRKSSSCLEVDEGDEQPDA